MLLPLSATLDASNQANGASLLHFWNIFTTLHGNTRTNASKGYALPLSQSQIELAS